MFFRLKSEYPHNFPTLCSIFLFKFKKIIFLYNFHNIKIGAIDIEILNIFIATLIQQYRFLGRNFRRLPLANEIQNYLDLMKQ